MRRTVTWLATAIVAAGALLGTSVPARADVLDDNPAVASRGQDDMWLFARRTSDGATLVRHYIGGGWSPWESLGGTSTSGPAAAAYGPYVDVFIRGTDGAVWQNQLTNGAWSGWTSLGGFATSAPAAIARRGTNYLDVAVKGGDDQIYLRTYVPGTGWYPWGALGGTLTTQPALDSHSDGILDVFARGTDGAVYQQAWNGSQWLGWGSLGGGILGAPMAVNKQPHDLDVYVRGAGGAIYQNHWDSVNGWTSWVLLDSMPQGSSPAAVADSAGRELLFTRTGDEMYVKQWNAATGWTAWQDFGAIAVPPPPAPPPQEGELNLATGIRCTPAGGLLKVNIVVHKPKGKKKARVTKIVFFTKGKGARKRVDHKAPFIVHIQINKPAGGKGRVYARVYYQRGSSKKQHRKLVSRTYKVCA